MYSHGHLELVYVSPRPYSCQSSRWQGVVVLWVHDLAWSDGFCRHEGGLFTDDGDLVSSAIQRMIQDESDERMLSCRL